MIVKQTSTPNASLERMIYEQILPHSPISSLSCYGFVEDESNHCGWLFLEHADGMEYSPSIEEHRVLAARWLGLLHGSLTDGAIAMCLPDRGPDYYLENMQSARDRIIQNFANPALDERDRIILKKTLSICAELESRWGQVRGVCERMPQTLIHGDFAPKNLRVKNEHSGIAIQVFDWEHAGWGFPGSDLVQSAIPFKSYWASPELDAYYSVVMEYWPHLDIEVIRSSADVGKIFRLLVWLNLDAKSLETQWVEGSLTNIRLYLDEMGDLTKLS